MKTDGHAFLEELGASLENTVSFDARFCRISARLGLGDRLDRYELNCLYQAAFQATLCNIAFNGLGGCAGEIHPDRELFRRNLEAQFMAARDRFFATEGWAYLPPSEKGPLLRTFLTVLVEENNLVG
jgi:hypothetical protein